MQLQFAPSTVPSVVATAFTGGLAFYAWKRRRATPGTTEFALAMLAACLGILGYSLQMLSADLPSALFWARFKMVGLASAPVAMFAFALVHTGWEKWLTRKRLLLLFLMPLAIQVGVWTNNWHHLFWCAVGQHTSGSLLLLDFDRGIWFWAGAMYTYTLYSIGMVVLFHQIVLQRQRLSRRQALLVTLGALAPISGTLLYLADLGIHPDLDLQSLSLALGGLLVALGLFRYRLLDIVPVARAVVIESMRDGMIVLDAQGRIVDLNPAAERFIGQSAEEVVGKSAEGALADYPGLLESHPGAPSMYTRALVGQEGIQRHYELSMSPIRDHKGNEMSRVITVHDITEYKRAEAALQESEERYRGFSGLSLEGIALHDGGVLVDFNPAFARIFGYTVEELAGINVIDVIAHPDYADVVRGKVASGDEKPYEILARKKDGTVFPLEMEARQVQCKGRALRVVSVRDITERRRLQAQLRQATKMEAIGRLAGGIAHDFNNLLTIINGYSQFALDDLDDNNPLHNDLKEIRKAGERAASLTTQLLAFSRRQVMEMRVIDLNQVLVGMGKMLGRLIGEHVDLRVNLAEDLYSVKADSNQIEQIVVNLAVNARDAMSGASLIGGTLTIETENVELDKQFVITHAGAKVGQYVMLSVSDTGVGMTDEVKEHIFEPFFTTKKLGKGTGLGLATIYGIVKQSNGFIYADSELGQGTTFRIYLPRIDEEPEPAGPKEPESARPRGTETVLVVEDEDGVRTMAARTLRQLGYRVLEAASGAEALELCQAREEPIDLVLTDVVMPGMAGHQLVGRLRKSWQHIRALYVSGYTGDVIDYRGVWAHGVRLVQKPFTVEELATRVRQALDAG